MPGAADLKARMQDVIDSTVNERLFAPLICADGPLVVGCMVDQMWERILFRDAEVCNARDNSVHHEYESPSGLSCTDALQCLRKLV